MSTDAASAAHKKNAEARWIARYEAERGRRPTRAEITKRRERNAHRVEVALARIRRQQQS